MLTLRFSSHYICIVISERRKHNMSTVKTKTLYVSGSKKELLEFLNNIEFDKIAVSKYKDNLIIQVISNSDNTNIEYLNNTFNTSI